MPATASPFLFFQRDLPPQIHDSGNYRRDCYLLIIRAASRPVCFRPGPVFGRRRFSVAGRMNACVRENMLIQFRYCSDATSRKNLRSVPEHIDSLDEMAVIASIPPRDRRVNTMLEQSLNPEVLQTLRFPMEHTLHRPEF
jgi:hypothetical protein